MNAPTRNRTTLSARSVVASTLLGTHPPRLAGRLLVALASEFGISPGTTRVALSRMVDRGELRNDDGTYELSGALLERQERQERGRALRLLPWDGTWQVLIERPGLARSERDVAARAAIAFGMAARREGVWMRPDNLDPDRLPASRRVLAGLGDWYSARPEADPAALTAELWDLDGWASRADGLRDRMDTVVDRLDGDDPGALVGGFELSAEVLRHLVHDPQLPPELVPPTWPAEGLRTSYSRYDEAYRRVLRAFFRAQR